MAAAASKSTNIETLERNALRAYVSDMVTGIRRKRINLANDIRENIVANNVAVSERIASIVRKQPPLTDEKVVYRGQTYDRLTQFPVYWISTSSSRKVAVDMFVNKKEGCCVFEIHLQPGVRILDVNAMLGEHGHSDEKEIIIEGGGGFFQDNDGTILGFKQIREGEYKTYYFPPGSAPVLAAVAVTTAAAPVAIPALNDERKRTFLESAYTDELELFDGDKESINLNGFYSGLKAQEGFKTLGISKNNVKRFLNSKRNRRQRRRRTQRRARA